MSKLLSGPRLCLKTSKIDQTTCEQNCKLSLVKISEHCSAQGELNLKVTKGQNLQINLHVYLVARPTNISDILNYIDKGPNH